MRMLITSDHHHHPTAAFSRTLPGGINSRLAESLAVEDALTDIMSSQPFALHVRCGDLYEKKRQIDAIVLSEMAQRIRNNSEVVEEFALIGNHDEAGALRHTLEIFKHTRMMTVVDSPSNVDFFDVRFGVVPYQPHIQAMRKALNEVRPTPKKCNILLVHHGVVGAKTGSEFVLPESLTVAELHPERWDYVFLGHCHEPQQLASNVWYVGSLTQRTFADVGNQRRAFALDTEKRTLTSIPLPGPRFEIVQLQPDELMAYTPDPNTYYKVVVPISVLDRVDQVFDHRCLGWIPHAAEDPAAVDAPRMSGGFARWEDACAAYISQIRTTLDEGTLMDVAREAIGVEGDGREG